VIQREVYLLRAIPHRIYSTLPPCNFPEIVHTEIQLTIQEVRRTFDVYDDVEIRNTWKKWNEVWAPKNDCAVDYITHMRTHGNLFHIPLKTILLNKNISILMHEWC
jgi:hypothetical protein